MERILLALTATLFLGTAFGDEPRRPMVLMVMFDGMRADAIEAADMPNLTKLRNGTWQNGYKGAWTITGQTEPIAAPNSAPNHVSIATGVLSTKHGVSANGQIASGNYTQYPTWMKRVVDANTARKALFVYSWSEDADLGLADGVTFINQGDAGNAVELAERLASTDAPDATLYFIDLPDHNGHSSGFYPHSDNYLAGLTESDGYLGACLDAIVNRPTFNEEDWLILVTGDHGGYGKNHGQTTGRQAHTVPIIIAGRDVTPGRLPGSPYNFDIAASAIAHFGLNPVSLGLDATLIDQTAVTDTPRLLDDGLAVYLPFDTSETENTVDNSGVTPEINGAPAITSNGMVGSYLNIPSSGSYLRLLGSDSLTFEGDNKSFTAIVWVKMDTQTSDPVIFGNSDWNKGVNKGALLCAARKESWSSTAGVGFNGGSGSARMNIGPFDYEASDRWTFYAVTRSDEGVITTYQGRSDGTLNWASAPFDAFVLKSGYPFCIGQDGTGNYKQKFVGGVDDFALWTRGLSHEEIRRIYTYGRAGMGLGGLLTIESNDAPTMTANVTDTDTVTLEFGGRRTRNYQLCVASGETDAPNDKYAWSHFETVATITPTTTDYTYTIPQALKDADAKFRFFLMQTETLPYAREVAYVHSDGGSYIDTGIAPRRDLTATFDILLTEQNGTWDWMFGAYGSSSNKKANFGIARHIDTGFWHLEISGNNDRPFACTLNVPHHVIFSTVLLEVDDVQHGTGLVATSFIESGWPINIFRNLKVGAAYDQTMKGRYSTFTLATTLCTVRDFVPVVTADGTAGMFDNISGRFYASGGDALTAGEDRDAARYGWVRAQSDTYNANANVPVTAVWVGEGTDTTDLADPANWVCRNVLDLVLPDTIPTADTDVTVSGATTFAVPAGTTWVCKSVTINNARLAADADWSGLDINRLTAGSTIDLNGQKLTLSGVGNAVFTVTDSSTDTEHPGELHLVIGEGIEAVNQDCQLDGNLRLVKEGPGALTASKANQTYTGGTLVAAGCVKFGVTSVNAPFGVTGTTIEVAAGATADAWSRNINNYSFILDGGKLLNTRNLAVADMISAIMNITLTADSEMVFDANNSVSADKIISNGSVWDLGNHTLTIVFQGNDPDIWFGSNGNKTGSATLVIKNGTVKTQGNGWFHDIDTDGTEGGSYDIATILRHYGTSTVSNLTVRATNSDVAGNGVYRVYGTFTPLSPYGHNVQMLDGSTIDLSEKTGSWSTTFVNKNNSKTVTFDEGATVMVNLYGRDDISQLASSDTFVMTWASPPDEGVTFIPDETTAERGFSFVKKEGGLCLIYTGTVFMIR